MNEQLISEVRELAKPAVPARDAGARARSAAPMSEAARLERYARQDTSRRRLTPRQLRRYQRKGGRR
jgi:hypothetical protein